MKVGYACPEIVTGKPVELGGCIGRREATGRGVVYCILEAMKELEHPPRESTAVVQGFGNVGSVACQELDQRGIKVIAVGDRYGAIRNTAGHRHPGADSARRGTGKTDDRGFPGAEAMDAERPADDALHRSGPGGAGTGDHRHERGQDSNAGSWPRGRTARPRPTPTPSWRTATSSSSRTCSATPAA